MSSADSVRRQRERAREVDRRPRDRESAIGTGAQERGDAVLLQRDLLFERQHFGFAAPRGANPPGARCRAFRGRSRSACANSVRRLGAQIARGRGGVERRSSSRASSA